jgi:hypothetical protein
MPVGAVSADQASPADPSSTGELTNDVGETVIVPKDGESFQDTVKRAVARNRSLSPQHLQNSIDKEMATAPEKVLETLGAAAGIGVAAPALLAAPMEVYSAIGTGLKVLPAALEAGAKGVSEWAAANPVAAKAIWYTLKAGIKAAGFGAGVSIVEKMMGGK